MRTQDKSKDDLIRYLNDDLKSDVDIPREYYYSYKLSCRLNAYCEVIDNATAKEIMDFIIKKLDNDNRR